MAASDQAIVLQESVYSFHSHSSKVTRVCVVKVKFFFLDNKKKKKQKIKQINLNKTWEW
jgi:hypothetical protein